MRSWTDGRIATWIACDFWPAGKRRKTPGTASSGPSKSFSTAAEWALKLTMATRGSGVPPPPDIDHLKS